MRQGGTEIRGSECQAEPGRGGEVLLASEFEAGFQPRPGEGRYQFLGTPRAPIVQPTRLCSNRSRR